MVSRFVKWALIGLCGLGVAGCWDRVEIEQRGFVVGIAIDQEKGRQQSRGSGSGVQAGSAGNERYVLTYQIVNPEAMQNGGKPPGGKSMGSGGGKPMLNVTSEGKTLLEATREMVTRTSRTPYIEHLKMIVISERLAKEGNLGSVLDLYLRDNEARRGTKIFVSQGNPKEALEVDPQNEKLPVLFIDSIAGNVRKNGKMLRQARIGDVHEMLLTNESFAVPRMIVHNKQVELTGAAVIHGYMNRMVGFLDDQETEALNYLTERMKSDVIDVQTKKGLISFESKHLKRKVTASAKNPDSIAFTISIRADGVIGESFADYDYKKQEVIAEVERKAAEQIESRCRQLIDKLQRQYKADVLGLGKHLHYYHPKAWNQVKNDWDYGETLFSKCKIEVKATVTIRDFGAIHKAQKYRTGG